MDKIKELPNDLVKTIVTNLEPTLNISPISDLKNNFISAVNTTIRNNPYLSRQTYIEGMVCSQVRRFYGGSYKFNIRNKDGQTIPVYVPYSSIIKNPINTGSLIGIKGTMHVYDKSLSSGYDFLQLKADSVKRLGVVTKDYKELMEYVRRNKRKKKIKFLGKKVFKIALITSSQSEAIYDIHKCLDSHKFFSVNDIYVNLYNAEEIAKAVSDADSSGYYDAILLSRGGTENIDVFNEYCILNSIFSSKTLVVSAVGHASNNPLSNFVADISEDTPSASARLFLHRYQNYTKNKSFLIFIFVAVILIYFYFHR